MVNNDGSEKKSNNQIIKSNQETEDNQGFLCLKGKSYGIDFAKERYYVEVYDGVHIVVCCNNDDQAREIATDAGYSVIKINRFDFNSIEREIPKEVDMRPSIYTKRGY